MVTEVDINRNVWTCECLHVLIRVGGCMTSDQGWSHWSQCAELAVIAVHQSPGPGVRGIQTVFPINKIQSLMNMLLMV